MSMIHWFNFIYIVEFNFKASFRCTHIYSPFWIILHLYYFESFWLKYRVDMAMGQNLVPVMNMQIAGQGIFILLNIVFMSYVLFRCISIYIYIHAYVVFKYVHMHLYMHSNMYLYVVIGIYRYGSMATSTCFL